MIEVALGLVPFLGCVAVGIFLDITRRVKNAIVYFFLGAFGMLGTWALTDYLLGG